MVTVLMQDIGKGAEGREVGYMFTRWRRQVNEVACQSRLFTACWSQDDRAEEGKSRSELIVEVDQSKEALETH
jgi:hypothetical protein